MIRLVQCYLRTVRYTVFICFFFFNDTATTEIYTLSLHDALPIYQLGELGESFNRMTGSISQLIEEENKRRRLENRSEEHTSELQSPDHLVCRLLLEKKKKRLSTKEISV